MRFLDSKLRELPRYEVRVAVSELMERHEPLWALALECERWSWILEGLD